MKKKKESPGWKRVMISIITICGCQCLPHTEVKWAMWASWELLSSLAYAGSIHLAPVGQCFPIHTAQEPSAPRAPAHTLNQDLRPPRSLHPIFHVQLPHMSCVLHTMSCSQALQSVSPGNTHPAHSQPLCPLHK